MENKRKFYLDGLRLPVYNIRRKAFNPPKLCQGARVDARLWARGRVTWRHGQSLSFHILKEEISCQITSLPIMVGKSLIAPEEGAKGREKFGAWISGLGDAVVNPGTPLGTSKTVSSDGVSDDVGPNPLIGFSILKADSMDTALEMAKGCPFLDMGTIGVAEMKEM